MTEFMDSRPEKNFWYDHHEVVRYMQARGYCASVSEWAPKAGWTLLLLLFTSLTKKTPVYRHESSLYLEQSLAQTTSSALRIYQNMMESLLTASNTSFTTDSEVLGGTFHRGC